MDLLTLQTTLYTRTTPERVLVQLDELGALDALPGAAAASARRLVSHQRRYGFHTSMPDTFRRHPGLDRATASAVRALSAVAEKVGNDLPVVDGQDVASLRAFISYGLTLLGMDPEPGPVKKTRTARVKTSTTVYEPWTSWDGVEHKAESVSYSWRAGSRGRRGDSHGHADPRTRMSADERRAALPGVSVRTYRTAVRTLCHLQQRTEVLAAERDREAAVAFGKSRLAYMIGAEEFCANTPTAAFVAYYVARLGKRTVFTNGSQDRPMDEIAEALLNIALDDPGCRADVIAKVLTRQSVLSRLSEQQKGHLLGVYFEAMAAFSRALAGAFDPKRDLTRMVARPGDDSSTWNTASRAFNQARTGWLNIAAALDMAWMVEASCPGKVPALIAADVAQWQSDTNGGAHVDGAVFVDLPRPWDVVLNGAECTAEQVRAACAKHGLDADTTGWTQAYRQDTLAVAALTPELVHGVAVDSPYLAQWLRKAGAYAGRATVDVAEVPCETALRFSA